jgi:hypothetical protein
MVTQTKFPVIFNKLGEVHKEIVTLPEHSKYIKLPHYTQEEGIMREFICSRIALAKPGIDTILYFYLDDKVSNAFSKEECEELWHLILLENKFVETGAKKDERKQEWLDRYGYKIIV